MNAIKHLVSVGDLVLDVVLPVTLPVQARHHQHTGQLRADPGGAGNVMIAARRLGLDVSAVGTVGDDPFGQQILDGHHAEGIDTRGVAVPPASASTLVVVLTDSADGEHVFVGHRGGGPVIEPTEVTREIIASAHVLFVDGFALADARTQALAFDSMAQARAAGIPVYFDPGPMLPRAQPDTARRGAALCDVLLLPEDEAAVLLGGQANHRQLLSEQTVLAVVKAGHAGCTIVAAEETRRFRGFPAQVKDTVGAGDCFDAAFMTARLKDWTVDDAATLANAAGAASVQKLGAGTNAPTCDEINAVLAAAALPLRYACEGKDTFHGP